MKGVILVAGKGTRLYPLTKGIPKGLLPIYDRPMIYFALEFMKSTKVKDVMIVVSSECESAFKTALGDGSDFGLNLHYQVQQEINGTAGALREVSGFFEGDDVVLYYGDNVLLSHDMDEMTSIGLNNISKGKASILALEVANPSDYGVIETDDDGNIVSLEEKPLQPKSNFVSTGIYFFPKDVCSRLLNVQKSSRGEYEVTDVNKAYLDEGRLMAIKLSRETYWYDAGNFDVLLEANNIAKAFFSK